MIQRILSKERDGKKDFEKFKKIILLQKKEDVSLSLSPHFSLLLSRTRWAARSTTTTTTTEEDEMKASTVQFDRTRVPTPYSIHLCSLLEIACQPNSEIGTSTKDIVKYPDRAVGGRDEHQNVYDTENAYESLSLKFRKKIVRFVAREVLESGKRRRTLCEPDCEQFWRRVYRFFIKTIASKKKRVDEEEEEEEMEISRANVNGEDEDEEDDEDDEEEDNRFDKTQQVEDFFHVLQTKEKYLLESVDELVRKFERLPKCLARETRDCFVVTSDANTMSDGTNANDEDLAARKIDPESVCGRFLRRQVVEFERLSFDGVCECHEMLRRYREDFDAFVNAAAEEMNGGDKGEVTFLLHRTSKGNERAIVDALVEKCERLGVKKSSLVTNEDESNEEEDKTLPFGVAMGLGGILDPRNKAGNNNNSSNSGNTEFPTRNKSVGAALRKVLTEHEHTAIHNRHPRARHVESLKQKDVVNALFHLHRHFETNGGIPADESVLLHELISSGSGGGRSAHSITPVSQSGRRAAEALIGLGATHAQFQHRKETARALEEATRIAQQSGDEDALAKALALSGLLAESEYFDDDDDDDDDDLDMDNEDSEDEPYEESFDDTREKQQTYTSSPSSSSVLKKARRSRTLFRRCLKLGRQLKNPALASYAELALARQADEFQNDGRRDRILEERGALLTSKNAGVADVSTKSTTSLISAPTLTQISAPEVIEKAIQNVEVLSHKTTLVASAPATRTTAEHMRKQEIILREKDTSNNPSPGNAGGANGRANTTGQQQQQTQGGGNQSLDAIAVAQATSLIRMNEIYPASSSTMTSSSTSGGKLSHTSLGTLQRYATFDTAKETKYAINCLRTPAFAMQSTTWSTRGDDGLARVANLKALSEETLKDASPVDAARAFAVSSKSTQTTRGTERALMELEKAESRLREHIDDNVEVSRELDAARISILFDDAIARNDCFEANECMRQMHALVHPIGEKTDSSAVLEANRALAEIYAMNGNYAESFETFLRVGDILTFTSSQLKNDSSMKSGNSSADPRNAMHVLKSELGVAETFKNSQNYAFALLRALGVDKRAADLGVDQFALFAKLIVAECLIELKGSHANVGKLYLEKYSRAFLSSNELRLRARFHLINAKASLEVNIQEETVEEMEETVESIIDDLNHASSFGEKLGNIDIVKESQYLLAQTYHFMNDVEKRNEASRAFRRLCSVSQ